MRKRLSFSVLVLILFLTGPLVSAQEQSWEVGLSASRTVIQAQGLSAGTPSAPTILYLSGLAGESTAATLIRALHYDYAQLDPAERRFHLISIPVANPDADMLEFPPRGEAYGENPVAHALWRWLAVHAPDLIVIAGPDAAGLGEALQREKVAGVGSIPVQVVADAEITLAHLQQMTVVDASDAHREINRRLQRSPLQLAQQLAQFYGQDFSTAVYVPGMSIIGRMRLSEIDAIEALMQAHLSNVPLAINNASALAGQLVFAEYAERTGNAAALALAVQAADLGFDAQGNMLEAMPFHNEMSDSMFMAPPLLTKVGKLSGESRYFDMAARHIAFMQDLLRRDDGLYRHSPLADVAWSRGNGFPALGLTLVLADFPPSHPAYGDLLASYLQLLEALIPYQDADGMWREVIDYPGAFAEITTTAMIGIAIKRGIDRGWLDATVYGPVLENAWQGVLARTSLEGEFIDACTSTGKFDSLAAYLDRPAILGRDDRAGGIVMNFANEMAGNL
jgi:unsaturated rhamnogalacturonyl hydrolase